MSRTSSVLASIAASLPRTAKVTDIARAAIIVAGFLNLLPPSAYADDLPTFSISSFTASERLFGVTAGDFNNDGLSDFAVCKSQKVTVYFSDPANPGTFHNPIDIALAGTTLGYALDINHDGWTDLVLIVAAGTWKCLGNPPGSLAPLQEPVPLGTGVYNFGDFNHDGWPDIITFNVNGDIVIFLNGGPAHPGEFGAETYGIDTSVVSPAPQAAVGDFNADGWADFAVAEQSPVNLHLRTYLNNHNGTFTIAQSLYGFPPSSDVGKQLESADFNGDGRLDVAFTTGSDGSFLGVFLARPAPAPADGKMLKYSNKGGLTNPLRVRVADFNLDGWPDFLESAPSGLNEQTLVVLLNSPPPYNGYSFRPMHLAGLTTNNLSDVGDFNGDGKPDIVAVSTVTTAPFTITILLNTTPSTSCPADLNGDALVDDSDFVIFLAAYNQCFASRASEGCLWGNGPGLNLVARFSEAGPVKHSSERLGEASHRRHCALKFKLAHGHI